QVLVEQSLWAKWCHAYLLSRHNFWTAPAIGSMSWSWRQTLRLRSLAKEHIIYQCGNGETFSLWYDPWVQGDSIHALFGHRVIYDTGLGKQARVKDIIWEAPDRIFWNQVGVSFSTSRAWNNIRTVSNRVAWHGVVWHPYSIPKHAFSLWLTIRGALRTRDKLVPMGVLSSANCVFHSGEPETHDHLFFCPYSATVWKEILGLCHIVRPILPWADEVEWMSANATGNQFHQTLRKLALAASVYHLWIERN
ncbi:LOW QUALITY PROTEIN: zf-RVT domain-containing protein, partial [Cephalotus follicularis]